MAIYQYEAVSQGGELISDKIESTTISTAVSHLQNNGYLIIEIKEVKNYKNLGFALFSPKVKLDEINFFSRQLAVMIQVGIPIARALATLSKQTKNSTFRNALDDIASNVEGGMSITEAFASHPYIFNSLYLGMLNAGETGGNLAEMLLSISEHMQKKKNLKDNIKSAIRYPATVLSFSLIVLLIMLIFLVPVFESFFPNNQEIPGITKLIINISNFLRINWPLWIAFFIFFGVAIIFCIKNLKKGLKWDKFRFRIPWLGSILHKSVVARFTSVFATLINGGISIVKALQSAASASGSPLLESIVKETVFQLQEGSSLSDPLEKSGFFSSAVIQMLRVGEETGMLPDLLSRISEFYEEEVAFLSKNLTSILEPLLLIFVGIIVGGMVIALYLPIFTAVA